MVRTFDEINEKIRQGCVTVVTAEEMTQLVREKGAAEAARQVDVVTTGTFAPMCSSGAVLNTGHTTPRMKITKAWLNGVSAYGGIAAVDLFVGATEVAREDPLNKVFPGRFEYGGGHVIEDLVRGKDVMLEAEGYGTDCYPRQALKSLIRLETLNNAILVNPRNCYQNYGVAVNRSSPRTIYTYMGILRRNMKNANYCSAGLLSPLLNDPYYRTIGIGTRIFLGGGVGYVYFQGTQHAPNTPRNERGVPTEGAGTLAVTGDLKSMSADFLRGVSMTGYGCSLAVGIGIPIPILDEEMAHFTGVGNEDIVAPVLDYSDDYPNRRGEPLGYVTYAQLRSGSIEIEGRRVETAPLSSITKAREIATTLKLWIEGGRFLLGRPVEPLPTAGSDVKVQGLPVRT